MHEFPDKVLTVFTFFLPLFLFFLLNLMIIAHLKGPFEFLSFAVITFLLLAHFLFDDLFLGHGLFIDLLLLFSFDSFF